jgi:hypothetical protein
MPMTPRDTSHAAGHRCLEVPARFRRPWHADDVRWRTLLLVGVGITAVAFGLAVLIVQVVDGTTSGFVAEIVLTGVLVVVLVGVLGFVAGWFGNDRDDVIIVVIGVGITAALAMGIGSLASDAGSIAPVVLGIGVAVVAATIGRITWWIGDAICELRGLPTQSRLLPPAFPEESPGVSLWTTEAGPALRTTLDALADRVAPGVAVDARAVGIEAGLPRDRPVVVVLADNRLAVQPVDLAGIPHGEPTTLGAGQLAEVSIRSEAADGSIRKQVNAYDDIVEIRTGDGERIRLRLAYGTRGAGTTTAGPDAIRTWLRSNAATYR